MDNKEKFVLVERLYPQIEEALSEQRNIRALLTGVQKYADKHSEILLTTDMSQRLIFADTDKKVIFNATGISEVEVKKAVSDAPLIPDNWKKATNPFYMLMLLTIHYFSKKGDAKSMSYADALTVYLGYLLYTTNHKAFFPYCPNKQIMDYTINNLNNRYLLKKLGTIHGVIEHTVFEAMHGRFNMEIRRGQDDDFSQIISSLDARISSFVKYIADEFYENRKNGKYLFHEDEDTSEENFHLSDNISFKIDRVVHNVTSEIVSKGFDQNNVIKRSIALNPGVSEKKLDAMLRTIIEMDIPNISIMISHILTLFIYKGNSNTIEDVKTMKFISESMQVYKSNAQDPVTYKVKDILLHWIDLTSDKYGRNFISRGKTSLDNYRKAIYTCFVFEIFQCCK